MDSIIKFNPGLVSIIVPFYNSSRYISQCIESIINQDYEKIEIILVNDGSKDNSEKICSEFAAKNQSIKIISGKNNKGPSAARNKGLNISNGEFIFFVDSDDFIEKNAVKLLVEGIRSSGADVVIGDFLKINSKISDSGNSSYFNASRLLQKQDIIDYVLHYFKAPNKAPLLTQSWGKLFKLSIIKSSKIFFNVNLRTFEDLAFNFEYLMHAKSLFFLKKNLYNHRMHNNYASATMKMYGNNPESLFGFKEALKNAEKLIEDCCDCQDIKQNIGHAYICYYIIQLVRICGQINNLNKHHILSFVKETINRPELRNNLEYYKPRRGDSRILPLLIKLRFVWLAVLVLKYKARKRYARNIKT